MKNKAEVKIKKSATFQTRNRLGLPDVSFCFSEDSADATINIVIVTSGFLQGFKRNCRILGQCKSENWQMYP